MKMEYRCQDCSKEEMLWNSRDGVTPFIIGCRFCGGEARHIDWKADVRHTNYQPQPGERIFIDMTPEKAKEIATKRVESAKGTEYEIPEADREAIIEDIAKDLYGDGTTPDIETVN
jgi:DNA-directed RNA polymerase subunit RPC12/RpoP